MTGQRSAPHVPAGLGEEAAAWKLSANENPFPPLPGVLDSAVAAAGTLNRYPDPACRRLTAEIAGHHGVPPEHIAVGIGSVGVTQQLLQATAGPGAEVLFAWRSFEAYPELTAVVGAASVRVPLAPGAVHDLDAMLDAVTPRTRVVFVCNPNNPTGTVVRRAALERFLDRIPPTALVVLDEAYLEFIRDDEVPDGIDLYRDRPRLCVLRTFSKAYGLAGLRVGYAVAHEPVAAAIRGTALPFGVTLLAQDAAVASLRRGPAMRERVEALVVARDRLHAALTDQGWDVPPSQANFVWLATAERTAEFAAACARDGVLVRAFPDEGVRVSVGTDAANDRFLRIAAHHRTTRTR
ncbi:histidinol-phosphate transaminase [Streptomyces ziwulingensis]|uniref:Aromatic amino acid aminotransferase n=1 Tax=Streptomyces ziwulingensis TaxID=1045501 RepID=A0ABP9AV61_9ACTN